MVPFKSQLESITGLECRELSYGLIQVRTNLTYPDGDSIDIYVRVLGDQYEITDLSDTIGWFLTQGIDRKDIHTALDNIVLDNVVMLDGAILVYVNADTKINDVIIDMANAIRTICRNHSHYGEMIGL